MLLSEMAHRCDSLHPLSRSGRWLTDLKEVNSTFGYAEALLLFCITICIFLGETFIRKKLI